jgi:RNA polymerase sigma factor (sigma-70 family)
MRRAANTSDDDLLVATATGDELAFTALYERWERPLLAYFRKRTADSELAADLTAEVFAIVLEACRRWRPGGPPATAWLFTIAQRTLAQSRRRGVVADEARRRLAMAPVELGDADIARIDALGDEPLTRLLETLPPDQREAVRARVLDELTYEEIADRLMCSEAVVRKRVSRGLARLRQQIGGGVR